MLRRVDIESSGGGSASDHLIVFSPPTLDATAGQKLTHQIVARPKKGAITYTLASGPDGLTVSGAGELSWTVPTELKGQEVTAVVTVADASGDELFHTLKIRVR